MSGAEINCNRCKEMVPKESDQLKGQPHICQHYRKHCYHRDRINKKHSMIYPCRECVEDAYQNYEEEA